MPAVKINGLTMSVAEDELSSEHVDIQTFDRTEGMTFEGTLMAELREWSFTIPAQKSAQEANSQKGWIKGRGHYWNFERVDGATTRFNKYSTDGGPGFNTNMTSATSMKFGTWGARVALGTESTVTVTFGSEEAYTVSVWKLRSTGGWQLFSIVADGTTTTSYIMSSSAATVFPWITVSAASGYLGVSLWGRTQTGAGAGAAYDGLMILPYALTTWQLSAREKRQSAEPGFPYVELSGDVLEGTQPVVVKGFVTNTEYVEASDGGWKIIRIPQVRLVQKG